MNPQIKSKDFQQNKKAKIQQNFENKSIKGDLFYSEMCFWIIFRDQKINGKMWFLWSKKPEVNFGFTQNKHHK